MLYRYSRPSDPLVEKNVFRHRVRQDAALPSFDDVRPRLPVPLLPDDEGLVALYWNAWRIVWAGLRTPTPGSNLVAPYIAPHPQANLEMGNAAFLALLAGYLPGSYDLVSTLDNFYAGQHEDGFIGREMDPSTGKQCQLPFEPNSTGPALLTWAEWRHFRLTGDIARVGDVFWPLLAYHRWCRANRTWQSGLYWTTGYASGLVNQPRVPGGRFHHAHWAWVDASLQAAVDAALLERMAVQLGESSLAAELVAERHQLVRQINLVMWNEEQRFYQDVAPDGRFSAAKSISAYWALVDKQIVPNERLRPFVQHLRDTWSFRVENCLPSLSADSEGYNRGGNSWRGGVWPALTYMVTAGLRTVEVSDLGHQIAHNHLRLIEQVYRDTGVLWDNYAPEDPLPGDPAEEDRTGLTAMAIIGLILEGIVGLAVDWPLRQVTWHRHLTMSQPYGVRNLPLGNEGVLDMVAEDDAVRIRTDTPFTLIIRSGREVVQAAVPVGDFSLSLD